MFHLACSIQEWPFILPYEQYIQIHAITVKRLHMHSATFKQLIYSENELTQTVVPNLSHDTNIQHCSLKVASQVFSQFSVATSIRRHCIPSNQKTPSAELSEFYNSVTLPPNCIPHIHTFI